jgi:hypothetical protein
MLQNICQVDYATPDIVDQSGMRKNGVIHFDVFVPTAHRSGLQQTGRHVTTQHGFVAYLKTGKLPHE